jgi:hypothetical protein
MAGCRCAGAPTCVFSSCTTLRPPRQGYLPLHFSLDPSPRRACRLAACLTRWPRARRPMASPCVRPTASGTREPPMRPPPRCDSLYPPLRSARGPHTPRALTRRCWTVCGRSGEFCATRRQSPAAGRRAVRRTRRNDDPFDMVRVSTFPNARPSPTLMT